jgi:hypothetical protein
MEDGAEYRVEKVLVVAVLIPEKAVSMEARRACLWPVGRGGLLKEVVAGDAGGFVLEEEKGALEIRIAVAKAVSIDALRACLRPWQKGGLLEGGRGGG